MLDAGLLAEGLAKRHPVAHPLAHEIETALGHADKHHGVLKAARPQSALGNLKPAAFAQNEVLFGDADILKHEFAFSAGRVVAAKGPEGAGQSGSPACQPEPGWSSAGE